jgi:hypothetical protein
VIEDGDRERNYEDIKDCYSDSQGYLHLVLSITALELQVKAD